MDGVWLVCHAFLRVFQPPVVVYLCGVCGFGVLVSLCFAGVQFLALRRSRAAALPVRCNAGVFKVRLIMFLLTFRTVVLWRWVSPSVGEAPLAHVPLSHCNAVVSGVCPFLCTNPSRFFMFVCLLPCWCSNLFLFFCSLPTLPTASCKARLWPLLQANASKTWGGLSGAFDWSLAEWGGCGGLLESIAQLPNWLLYKGPYILVERLLGRLASTTLTNSWPYSKKSRCGQTLAVIYPDSEPWSELNKVSETLWRRVERCFVLVGEPF